MTLRAAPVGFDQRILQDLHGLFAGKVQLGVVDDWERALEHNSAPDAFVVLRDDEWTVGAAALQKADHSPASLTTISSTFSSGELSLLIDEALENYKGNCEWYVRGEASQAAAAEIAADRQYKFARQINAMVCDTFIQTPVITTTSFSPSLAGTLADLNNAAFAGHRDRAHWTAETVLEHVHHLDNDNDDILFGGEDQLDGFVWTRMMSTEVGEVHVLAVNPDRQRKGLGHDLLHAGVQHLVAGRKAKAVKLYVDASNTRAIKLYERYGFHDVNQPVVSYEIQGK